jgi:hypothetical protein
MVYSGPFRSSFKARGDTFGYTKKWIIGIEFAEKLKSREYYG